MRQRDNLSKLSRVCRKENKKGRKEGRKEGKKEGRKEGRKVGREEVRANICKTKKDTRSLQPSRVFASAGLDTGLLAISGNDVFSHFLPWSASGDKFVMGL
jgi:predicted transposase YdaD